jgi:predicted transport protein
MKFLKNEKWKPYSFKYSSHLQKNYAISNLGRLASFFNNIQKDGALLKGSITEGYNIIRLRYKQKYIAFLVHRAVAELFIKQKPHHKFVIHLNYNKLDNRVANLKWATQEEVTIHNFNNPSVIAAKNRIITKGKKLTITQVKQIKMLLANAKRKLTYKQIAEKYSISEMAVTRIKSGENWSRVTI